MEQQEYIAALRDCNNLSVIFQVTDKCVLACKYCFARGAHKGENPSISNLLLKKVISEAFETDHPTVSFEWTGGEALLMGLDFFKSVKHFQEEYANKPYSNCVQTSGYLFDKELIDYLIDNDFSVSVTIDGPEKIHNANRPTQTLKDSFDRVLATRNYIKKRTGSGNFICTITKNNLGHEREMLDYFGELGVDTFHSNPYIYFNKNVVKDINICLDNNSLASYFISQFNAWFDRGQLEPVPLTIDYFMSCLSSKSASMYTLCTFGGRCLSNFIAITPNGDCYNCPKFTGHSNMMLGNIYNMSLRDILDVDKNSKMKELVAQRLKAIEDCEKSNCRYAFICNGGCPYLSYVGSDGQNISTQDCTCKGKTMVLAYLEDIKNHLTHKYSAD